MPFVDDMDIDPNQKEKSMRLTGHDDDTLNVFGEIDEERTIWRYLDFMQLLHILQTGQLHFTRSDMFDDEEEGMLPQKEELPESFTETRGEDFFGRLKESVFINCWHINEHEDYNMWKSYSGRGVAIKSSIKSLRKSLLRDDYNLGIHFADVDYLDYEREKIEYEVAFDEKSWSEFTKNSTIEDFWDDEHITAVAHRPLVPFGYKRKYFGSDNELRAITMPNAIDPLDVDIKHIYCSVYLHDLIDKIVISPKVSDWEKECMKSVLSQRYGLHENEWVVNSQI